MTEKKKRVRHRIYLPRVEINFSKPADTKYYMDVVESQPGVFSIVEENVTEDFDPNVPHSAYCGLGFTDGDRDKVTMLDDPDDDVAKYCGAVRHTRVRLANEVVEFRPAGYTASVKRIKASSVEAIRKAVSHVTFGAFCPGNI